MFFALFKNAAALALLLLRFLLSFPGTLSSSLLLPGVVLRLALGAEDALELSVLAALPPGAASRLDLSVPVLDIWLAESLSFSFFAWVEDPNTRFRKPPCETLLPVVPASLNECYPDDEPQFRICRKEPCNRNCAEENDTLLASTLASADRISISKMCVVSGTTVASSRANIVRLL